MVLTFLSLLLNFVMRSPKLKTYPLGKEIQKIFHLKMKHSMWCLMKLCLKFKRTFFDHC